MTSIVLSRKKVFAAVFRERQALSRGRDIVRCGDRRRMAAAVR